MFQTKFTSFRLCRPAFRLLQILACVLMALESGAALASRPNFDGPQLRSLAYVSTNPDIVFAAGEGIYKSEDAGLSWRALSGGEAVDQILADPHDANRVIAFNSQNARGAGRYLVSVDGGQSWSPQSIPGSSPADAGERIAANMDGFSIHPGRPGVWAAIVQGKLWTTDNLGKSWEAIAITDPVLLRGSLVATKDAFYVASATQIWRSADGRLWSPTDFSSGSKVELLVALANDAVMVRTEQGWWRRTAGGNWALEQWLSAYERRHVGGSLVPGGRPGRPDYCMPKQSPASGSYIFAACSDNNRPMSGVVDYGAQRHSTDGGKTWVAIEGEGLPGAWFPTAVALHPKDPATVLMGWVSGRLFRSQDHGRTWQTSDAGLTFPPGMRNLPEYGLPYLQENELNRAVLLGDLEAVRQLAASGVNMNAAGFDGRTALDWALEVALNFRNRKESMYWELRALGAVPYPQETGRRRDLLKLASWGGLTAVVEDLLSVGWRLDWLQPDVRGGFLPTPLEQFATPCTALQKRNAGTCHMQLAGQPLEYWVNKHLSKAQPGESAQFLLGLARRGEPLLAQRVAAFDAGKYRDPEDAIRLLKELPPDAQALKALVFRGYEGRYGQLAKGGEIYAVLIQEMKQPAWVLDVLREDKGVVSAENAGILVKALLGPVNRPDWVRRLFSAGGRPRIDASGRQAVTFALVSDCEPTRLDAGFRAGVRFQSFMDDFGWSTMKTALWLCGSKPAAAADQVVARLHRAGQSLPRHEWPTLDVDAAYRLMSSARGAYYRGFLGQVAGIGVELADQIEGRYPEVKRVMEGFPAQLAGIRGGDRIVKVEGLDTLQMSLEYVALHLRGKPGSQVALTLERSGGQRVELRLRRRTLMGGAQPRDVEK